jgi:hypothetical protein
MKSNYDSFQLSISLHEGQGPLDYRKDSDLASESVLQKPSAPVGPNARKSVNELVELIHFQDYIRSPTNSGCNKTINAVQISAFGGKDTVLTKKGNTSYIRTTWPFR